MKDRIVSFQILRAVAVMLIFLSHCDNLIRINDSNCLIYLGAAGVSLFIALSGFLCAGKYSGKETITAIACYKKRWRQFYKNHIITLIIAVPLSISVLKRAPIKWGIGLIANATLTQSLIPTQAVYFSFNAVSWYLSLMCCFALLTPVSAKIWNHLSLKSTIALSAILNVIEFLIVVFGADHRFIHWMAYIFPIVRFLDFIIGGGYWKLGEYVREKQSHNLNRLLFAISSLIIIAEMVISCFAGNDYFLTAVWTLPATILVMSLYNVRMNKRITNDPLGRALLCMGNISFEFFLIHQLAIRYLSIIARRTSIPSTVAYILAFVLSIIWSSIMQKGTKTIRKKKV